MGLYDGFDVQAMLNFMSENNAEIKLESIGNRKWRLYTWSDRHGEFELEGTLFLVVMKAFKPYLKSAKEERALFQKEWNSIVRN
ncbi:hypothetical protein [Vibrio fluvialis]|uniref:hypothetical protein n=1 Tax=Vibrio fluvialis TaxID=676 RepID=UPI003D7D3BBF